MLPAQEREKNVARIATSVLAVHRPSDSLVLLRVARPDGFEFVAGQFTYVFVPNGVKRAYSIASSPADVEGLDLCVKLIEGGPGSTFLGHCVPGDRVEISRSLGTFAYRGSERVPVFLGTGTGVAPLRAMLLEPLAEPAPREAWLFLGSRERANLPYHDEFVALAQRWPSFHYVAVLSGGPVYGWNADRGWIQEAFLKRFPHPRGVEAYICGLRRMVDDVRMLLHGRGVPAAFIHTERFD